jgi:hypothetical protein
MATSKKKLTKKTAKTEPDESAVPSKMNPFPGITDPIMGSLPSQPGFNASLMGGPIPPQGMMPPMPGLNPMQAQASSDLFTSVGNMLRLSVDAINSVLAGSNQIMQAFTGPGHHPYSHYPHGNMHHHGCGCQCSGHEHHDHYHDSQYHSCCDVYGESCCNPSVNGCC